MTLPEEHSKEVQSTYVCYRTGTPIQIDGSLEENAWRKAPKSPRFVEVVSGGPALYDTRAAMLWDDQYLYVGFWVEEPFVQANLTERDAIIFAENDVEVFIDGIDAYYELEINARNTIYEVFFIWKDAYQRKGVFDVPEFDVYAPNVYTFGGNHDRSVAHFWRGSHPRGARWAFPGWDMPGLKTAVEIDGKINDPTNVDRGWTVEIAIPWSGMQWLAGKRALPPREGDEWRFQFARYEKLASTDHHLGWTWDPVGSTDNHYPERFTTVKFSQESVD
ncbi:MAG: carbohydrate-binding family 9-like protein [Firmicutes bacterium]|nr:carbohydrate-binding family 9-like protein [Bacillota bacterium]MCL5063642.1 carbohydrate-binding family 9-like protein [Bacillota bacterium]